MTKRAPTRRLSALGAAGLTGQLYRSDVTDEAAVAAMFQAIEADLGPVDVLVERDAKPAPKKHRGLCLE